MIALLLLAGCPYVSVEEHARRLDPDGDGFALDVDCDELDASVHPGAAEVWYDGVDQDCDGNDRDQDGDGVALDLDCDDQDPEVRPDAEEVCHDGKDNDCVPDDCRGEWAPGEVDGTVHVAYFPGDDVGTGLGAAIAVGDLDKDGIADIASGAWGGADCAEVAGRSEVIYGSWLAGGDTAFEVLETRYTGARPALAFVDDALVVGDPCWDGGGYSPVGRGRVQIYRGTLSGTPEERSRMGVTTFGEVVAAVPDLDGDGASELAIRSSGGLLSPDLGPRVHVQLTEGPEDVLLAAPLFARGFGQVMAFGVDYLVQAPVPVQLLTANPRAEDAVSTWMWAVPLESTDVSGAVSNLPGSRIAQGTLDSDFGAAIAACDLDEDGFVDAVVGAPTAIAGLTTDVGAVSVFLGPVAPATNETGALPRFTAQGSAQGQQFGASVACGGDFDGDGHGDLAIGAPGAGDGDGAVYVFDLHDEQFQEYGGLLVTEEAAAVVFRGSTDAGAGAAVAFLPDVDGDGRDELVFGAPGFSGRGGVFVLFGHPRE